MLEKIYRNLVNKYQIIRAKLIRRLFLISNLRLLTFLIIVFVCYKIFYKHELIFILGLILLLVFFPILLILQQNLSKRRFYYENLIGINKNELNCLSGNYSENYDGSDFLKFTSEGFVSDLDTIGANSLYQFISRTKTYFGHKNFIHLYVSQILKMF